MDAALPRARGRIEGFDNLAAGALPGSGGGSAGDLSRADPAADLADYGSDDALDALADSCEAGDLEACDNLFDMSPLDSSYEEYGDSCGGHNAPSDYCTEIYGG